jgi:DNA polymerase III subunit gamma/tau
MAYQSLYRRRRPLTFSDMIGQEHITRTLRNALLSEHVAHAYLFCGPRGTGKTTAAKIFARAMNCAEYPADEPCGKCGSCLNIAAGVSIDVIEMDAASNRGIDEIRELRERTRFASGESRYKVYIIDEAHMLTPEACNAFLKTLEEPPVGVIFILATTDPSKLPATIVSRCQRFDFHLLTVEQIVQRLEQIIGEESWKAEEGSLGLIARLAEGSLRDALGILEQCSAYGDETITSEHVRSVTGATRVEVIGALVEAAVDNDIDSGLEVIGQIVYSGRDLNLFLRDLTFVFSRLMLVEGSGSKKLQADLHGFDEVINSNRGKIERSQLLDAVELLHETGGELRHAHFPQYILEITFIRLVRTLHGRLRAAELPSLADYVEGPEKGKPAETPARNSAEALPQQKPVTSASKEELAAEDVQPAATEQEPAKPLAASAIPAEKRLEALKEAWPRLISEMKKRQRTTAAWLEPAVLSGCRGHLVILTYPPEYQIHQERLMGDNHRKLVESVLSSFCREQIEIRAEIGQVEARTPEITEETAPAETSSQIVRSNWQENKPETKKKAASVEEAQQIFGGKIIEND